MGMRGSDAASGALFSYVDMEARVPATHPLRTIRTIVNEVLTALDTDFEALYEGIGRQSVAPERLLRASLLQAFYSVRSERQLMEQINYNLLFRWFVGLGIDDAVWDHSTFSKNRERLLGADVAAKFLAAVLRHPKVTRFLSDEHFRSTARWWKPGPRSRVSAPRTVQTSHPRQGATASGISTTRSAATRRMPRPRTRMPGFIAKAAARLPSSATWDML
jgi:transposase